MTEDKTIKIICNGSIALVVFFISVMMCIFFIMPFEPCFLYSQFADPNEFKLYLLLIFAGIQFMSLLLPTISNMMHITWFVTSVIFMQRSLRMLS